MHYNKLWISFSILRSTSNAKLICTSWLCSIPFLHVTCLLFNNAFIILRTILSIWYFAYQYHRLVWYIQKCSIPAFRFDNFLFQCFVVLYWTYVYIFDGPTFVCFFLILTWIGSCTLCTYYVLLPFLCIVEQRWANKCGSSSGLGFRRK